MLDTYNHRVKKNLAAIGLVLLVALSFIYIPNIPMQSEKHISLSWLDNISGNHVLVFGGYPACTSTCPIALSTLRQVYLTYQLQSKSNDLHVVFANILQNFLVLVLGVAYWVYPGASHNRFEHCIGTSYLCGLMLTTLRDLHTNVHKGYLCL